jgi:hypothetical protein
MCRVTVLSEYQTVCRLPQPFKDSFETRRVIATTGANIQKLFFRTVKCSYFNGAGMYNPFICVNELRSPSYQSDILQTSPEHVRFSLFSFVVM